MVYCRPSSGLEGSFKMMLGGTDTMTVRVKLDLFFPSKAGENWELHGQFQPGVQITMQKNSAASAWADVKELIAAQDIDVVDSEGGLHSEAFLAQVEDDVGASIRWMVAVADSGNSLELQLQALPAPLAVINSNPVLKLDNVATIVLARFPITAHCFDGAKAGGPVPTVFSEDPNQTSQWLKTSHQEAFKICQGLASRYLLPESLTLEEAREYVKTPREGRGFRSFWRIWEETGPSPPKKQRHEPQDAGMVYLTPTPNSKNAKYSTERTNRLTELFEPEKFLCKKLNDSMMLKENAHKLVSMSLAKTSWAKHMSGWNSFKNFTESQNISSEWPPDIETIRAYVVWGLTVKNLAPDTVKAYLCSIKLACSLIGENVEFNKDDIVKIFLKGAENNNMVRPLHHNTRRVLTLPLLLLLGHRIAICNDWSEGSKQVVWTALVIGFFSSARIGELLPKKLLEFDPTADLTWEQVKFGVKGEVLLHIRLPKTSSKEGDFLDLFEFKNPACCPVSALKKLKTLCKDDNKKLPVFRFPSGANLTTGKLNAILSNLLGDICIPGVDTFSCHSIRAALPSEMGKYPEIFTSEDIMMWGRWRGTAYTGYTRFKYRQKKELFEKMSSVL